MYSHNGGRKILNTRKCFARSLELGVLLFPYFLATQLEILKHFLRGFIHYSTQTYLLPGH